MNVRFIVPGMSFRVRVRVKGFSVGPYGPWGQCALRGAQGPDVKNMRFIVPGIRFRVRVRVKHMLKIGSQMHQKHA